MSNDEPLPPPLPPKEKGRGQHFCPWCGTRVMLNRNEFEAHARLDFYFLICRHCRRRHGYRAPEPEKIRENIVLIDSLSHPADLQSFMDVVMMPAQPGLTRPARPLVASEGVSIASAMENLIYRLRVLAADAGMELGPDAPRRLGAIAGAIELNWGELVELLSPALPDDPDAGDGL